MKVTTKLTLRNSAKPLIFKTYEAFWKYVQENNIQDKDIAKIESY